MVCVCEAEDGEGDEGGERDGACVFRTGEGWDRECGLCCTECARIVAGVGPIVSELWPAL